QAWGVLCLLLHRRIESTETMGGSPLQIRGSVYGQVITRFSIAAMTQAILRTLETVPRSLTKPMCQDFRAWRSSKYRLVWLRIDTYRHIFQYNTVEYFNGPSRKLVTSRNEA